MESIIGDTLTKMQALSVGLGGITVLIGLGMLAFALKSTGGNAETTKPVVTIVCGFIVPAIFSGILQFVKYMLGVVG
jgi:hypothetical protein